jgi:23S rRNA (uracil1939-C5)-methyltransferase
MHRSKQCVVEIRRYSKKGLGQGTTAELSKGIEVRGAHPHEQVLAEVFKKKQGIHEARILEVLNAHPSRIEPRCLHAGICGGCIWQNLHYSQQCLYKEEHVKELFKDVLGEGVFFPIIPMKDPWAFRNKMEFSFYQDREGNKSLGLVMGGSKGRVVQLQECHLVRPWMAEVITVTKAWWESTQVEAYHRLRNTGTLHTLTLREGMRTGEKMVILTVSGNPCGAFSHQTLESFKEAMLAVMPEGLSLFLQIRNAQKGMTTQCNEMLLHGPDHIRETLSVTYPNGEVKDFLFKISPSSFFQPNTEQAEKLFSRALAMVGKECLSSVLDLYCGTATLGMIFSPWAEKVKGVELNPYAVFDAQVNQEVNGIQNLEVVQGDVKDLQFSEQSTALVIVDPPRAGLGVKIVERIADLKPQQILYISCNPHTQIEDVKEFLDRGYAIKAMQPVDQFPHSAHLENIVVLRKKKPCMRSI